MLLLALVVGVIIGAITGIIPGLHVNMVSAIAVSYKESISQFSGSLDIAVLIVAMASAHTILDVIPSIFLGAPSEAYAIAVLPGHRLLRSGVGFEGVRLATAGSVLAAGVALVASPGLWFVVPFLSRIFTPWTGIILCGVLIVLVIRESGWVKKWFSVVILAGSGFLGYLALIRLDVADPLLPLLSGLFGAASLVLALGEKSCLPHQFLTESIIISSRKQVLLIFFAVVSGWIVSLLPGVGAGQAAILSTVLLPPLAPGEYLFLVGGIGTVNFVLSIITAATIHKARNGAIASVIEVLPEFGWDEAIVLSLTALVGVGFGALLALGAGRLAVFLAARVPYKCSCVIVLVFVSGLVIFQSGVVGFVVYATGAALGVLCSTLGVGRTHLMACLMVPVVLYYWK